MKADYITEGGSYIYTARHAAFYRKNRLDIWKKRRLKYTMLRHQVVGFMGGKCTRCGFSDERALQIDHINGGGVREHKHISITRLYKNILAGASGYQLLCANCNWIKRVENDEQPPIVEK